MIPPLKRQHYSGVAEADAPEPSLKVRDLVRLNSGGPAMTVTDADGGPGVSPRAGTMKVRLVRSNCQRSVFIASHLSSTLPNLSGVAERFGGSLPECGRNFHAIRVEPGH